MFRVTPRKLSQALKVLAIYDPEFDCSFSKHKLFAASDNIPLERNEQLLLEKLGWKKGYGCWYLADEIIQEEE